MKEKEIIQIIQELIKSETGIVINKERLIDLEIVLHSRIIFHKMSPEKYVEFMKKNYDEIIFLASYFTIQETSFYRYKAHFDRLKFEIIPEIINENKKTIKILSAGCATGEEPYTISMILNDIMFDLNGRDIQIIATDINENALKLAKNGEYSEYKLRNIDNWYKNRYFLKKKSGNSNIYKLKNSVMKLVTFRHCNLIREPFELADLFDFDVIFCENVMIYFCMESIQRLINNFYSILKKDGYLFLGYSETLNFIKHKFNLTWWKESFAYKKSEKIEQEIYYDFNELICNQKNDINNELCNIGMKSYEEIINLIILNYNDELYENVGLLIKKIETANIKIDEIFYLIKAEYIYDKKEFINATNECRKAININPHSIDAHIILSAIYLDLNMFDSAEFEIKTSLYIENGSILANYYYAQYQKKKNNPKYINYMEKAREMFKGNNGILKTKLYPLNKIKRKLIFNDILNLNN